MVAYASNPSAFGRRGQDSSRFKAHMSHGKTLSQEKAKKDEKLQHYENTKTHQGDMEGASKPART